MEQWVEIDLSNSRRVGSGSRDQWETIQEQNRAIATYPHTSIATVPRSQSRPPLSSSSPRRSKEELDFILNNNTAKKYGNDDESDDDESDCGREPSEASTAVTGNISRFSNQKESNKGRVVTPETSPQSRYGGKGRGRGRDRHRDGRRRDDDSDDHEDDSFYDNDDDGSSYRDKNDNRRRSRSRKHGDDRIARREKSRSKSRSKSKLRSSQPRLFMCGAMDVTEEMRGSMKDANESIRQIISSVRKFGPEEKDAVRETVKDAKEALRRTLRSAVSCRGK